MSLLSVIPTYRHEFAEAFFEVAPAPSFLSSFAREIISTQKIVDFDIQRTNEEVAIDILPGTASRKNKWERYSTKEYAPPSYAEALTVTTFDLEKRLPGMTNFESFDTARALGYIGAQSAKLSEKINRAIELQAANALVTGKIPLVNGDTIDFKQKASHQITGSPSTAAEWDAEIRKIADAIRIDSKKELSRLIWGKEAWTSFINTDGITERLKFTQGMLTELSIPNINTAGAAFVGRIVVGALLIECWVYEQVYKVPEGFGLPNEGTSVPYIPDDIIVGLARDVRFDLFYGGIPFFDTVNGSVTAGVSQGRFYIQDYVDVRKNTWEIEVQSRPLFIPTEIDAYATYTKT